MRNSIWDVEAVTFAAPYTALCSLPFWGSLTTNESFEQLKPKRDYQFRKSNYLSTLLASMKIFFYAILCM
jgi:hypothetical protein